MLLFGIKESGIQILSLAFIPDYKIFLNIHILIFKISMIREPHSMGARWINLLRENLLTHDKKQKQCIFFNLKILGALHFN